MADLFRIDITLSRSHWVVPRIIIGLLIIIGAVLIVQNIISKYKRRKTSPIKRQRFYEEGSDKLKLFGSMILLTTYIYVLDSIGFLVSSLIFVFLFGVLFEGKKELKSILGSAILSIVVSLSSWYIFGVFFNITLPY